jgi:hypothetical protein
VTEQTERPLLFLDVDGTLLPLGHARIPSSLLPCELIWATAWMEDANEVLSPLLGLPRLPVADLPEVAQEDESGVLNWKTRALVRAAAGRPFVWADDEITGLDQAWVSAHHGGHALLHPVDSMTGLTGADLAVIDGWLLERSRSHQRG